MICDEKKCTGCFACYNICPKNAINMVEDEYGYIYPKIDKKRCINCNLCKKICPELNEVNFNKPFDTYAMIAKNAVKRKESSSGGAATILAEEFIKIGGIVYGCSYFKGCHIKHIRIDNIDELDLLKGSKYVQSYTLDTFKNVKEDLKKNKKVLYIGTPCQIAGLKNYIGNKVNLNNLFLIDLICHGVPPQKYLKDNLDDKNDDIVSFRNENGYVFTEIKNNKIIKETPARDSFYYKAFFDALIFRESCYSCKYAKQTRCSDITLGDFWGLSSDSQFYVDKSKGVSLILINTLQGEKLFNIAKNEMILEKRFLDEASKGNCQLNKPKEKNKNYYKFRKLYLKYGFEKAYRKINKFGILKNKLSKNKILNKIYHLIKK